MSAEALLRDHIEGHHDACLRRFLDELRKAALPSYVAANDAQILPALSRSMDLLLTCMMERTPERYVTAQRAIFAERVKEGMPVQEILAGLDSAQAALDTILDEAFAEAPEHLPAMRQRGQRYLLMTRTALVTLLGGRG